MKSVPMVLCLAAAVAAQGQTAAKPATSGAKPAATRKAAASAGEVVKYPPGIKAEPGVRKALFTLRVQDLKMGTGPEAEPMKIYHVKYTGWRAADGVVFDSWDEHPTPIMDKDGKPETGADGKPKVGPAVPASFPVGFGRMIPGFDQGFAGMRVGGIRRIFIPWQLGYGTRTLPDRDADHPGIPAKSDLVFDVELVEVTDPPPPQAPRPNIPKGIPPGVPGGAAPPQPATPPTASQPSNPPQPSTPQPK